MAWARGMGAFLFDARTGLDLVTITRRLRRVPECPAYLQDNPSVTNDTATGVDLPLVHQTIPRGIRPPPIDNRYQYDE